MLIKLFFCPDTNFFLFHPVFFQFLPVLRLQMHDFYSEKPLFRFLRACSSAILQLFSTLSRSCSASRFSRLVALFATLVDDCPTVRLVSDCSSLRVSELMPEQSMRASTCLMRVFVFALDDCLLFVDTTYSPFVAPHSSPSVPLLSTLSHWMSNSMIIPLSLALISFLFDVIISYCMTE